MSEEQSGVWEGVRRALGRLIGSVHVRELAPEFLTARTLVAVSNGLAEPSCPRGAQETTWKPAAHVVADLLPHASAGADGVDLAGVTTIIGMNGALRPEEIETFTSPVLTADCAIHRLDAGSALQWAAMICKAEAAIVPGSVREAETCLASPPVRRLPMDPPTLPRLATPIRRGRQPSSAGAGRLADAWRLADVRVRSGMTMIAQVPLTRARRPALPGIAPIEASAMERRRLAQTTGIALEDIVLMGVYAQVPVAAVRRLALEEGGETLLLWLKPEALDHAAAGRSPRLATLVIGRQRSTGKMIQTVA